MKNKILLLTIISALCALTITGCLGNPNDVSKSSKSGVKVEEVSPESSYISSKSSTSETSLKSATTSKPETSSKPATTSKPETSSKPATTSKPETSSKPETISKPETSSKPETISKPETSSKPSTTSKPETSSKPATTSKPEISSKPETISKPETSSKPSYNDIEKQALKDFAERMQTKGYILQGNYKDAYTKNWKVNKYRIDDFNHDGSYELVIQYYCSVYRNENDYIVDNPKQGIRLQIVKYVNDKIKVYCVNDDFNNYVRTAGADVGRHTEISEELFIDKNGNLGILTSKASIGGTLGLSYQLMTIENNKLRWSDGFGFIKFYSHGHYGFNNDKLINEHLWWEISVDNSYDFLYKFLRVRNIFNPSEENIDLKEFSDKFIDIDSLNFVTEFRITSESYPLSFRESNMNLFRHAGDCFYIY